MIEQRHGRLKLLIERHSRAKDGHIQGLWLCDCGETAVKSNSRVRHGYTKSCGCLVIEAASKTIHGMRTSKEYAAWTAMKQRCHNKNNKDYDRWGSRGIKVYPKWRESFEEFYNYIGPKPDGYSLDRIDNMKGYVPGNVRWASLSQQQQNRRNSYTWHIKGKVFGSHKKAAKHFDVSAHTVWRWVNGAFDKRRNTTTKPRSDCYAIPRY